MKMGLAHHNTPTTENVTNKELFRWNKESSDQFTIVDIKSEGWKLLHISKKNNVPAHLLLKAPLVWNDTAGPVFLVARTSVHPDHVVRCTHDTPLFGMAGIVDRYTGPEDFRATCRGKINDRQGFNSYGVMSFVTESGVSKAVFISEEIGSQVVRSISGVEAGMGWVEGINNMILDEESYQCSDAKEVGFVTFLENPGTHGGECIRIFDYAVERLK